MLAEGRILLQCGGGVIKYYYLHKLHRLGVLTGIDIPINVVGKGLFIPHGKVVISHLASIGECCTIYSDVTIGIDGVEETEAATIGNNVIIGTGARIIGNVKIADGVVIGANAVVCKDILEQNAVVVGIPSRIVKYRGAL